MYRRSYHERNLASYMEEIGEGGEEVGPETEHSLSDSKTFTKPQLSDVDEGNSIFTMLLFSSS